MDIKVKKKDILPYIYFVCSMAQQSKNGMYGALSTKNDMIGGIFDRWINIIPESVSFNNYFLIKAKEKINCQKNIKVYSDFFIYKPNYVGIAPDVFGLKIDNKIVPFVKFDENHIDNNCWIPQPNCPQIEIKSFFGKKYMISLRNQHYDDKYLVMIEADIDSDYLLPFFNETLFSNIESTLNMPNEFIIDNKSGYLSKVTNVQFDKDDLGSLNILTVTTANDFIKFALKLSKGDIPRYFQNVEERKILIKDNNFVVNESL
ncbi:MAG: hypothetical protein MJ066_04925, partial [Clostridia bacterium]|nr:hypothetical protein [Clostridia bacterium]